jgi:hypothetical protein
MQVPARNLQVSRLICLRLCFVNFQLKATPFTKFVAFVLLLECANCTFDVAIPKDIILSFVDQAVVPS